VRKQHIRASVNFSDEWRRVGNRDSNSCGASAATMLTSVIWIVGNSVRALATGSVMAVFPKQKNVIEDERPSYAGRGAGATGRQVAAAPHDIFL
jgi:hypothetical protein